MPSSLHKRYAWKTAGTNRTRSARWNVDETKKLPDAEKLLEPYRQLRRVEGILRRWSYEGEVVLPDDPAPDYRVSVRCGFATTEEFWNALAKWRKVDSRSLRRRL